MGRHRSQGRHIVIRRAKGGISGAEHLAREDRRTLAALRAKNLDDRFVFVSKRHGVYQPLSRDAFAKALATAGQSAGIDRRLCHPHELRHASGHFLANSGRVNAYQLQAELGHKDARSTHIYVQGRRGFDEGAVGLSGPRHRQRTIGGQEHSHEGR